MIRRLARKALKRLVSDAPHIPSAPGTGRPRPTKGQAPPPAEAAPPREDPGSEDAESDGSEVELHAEELQAWVGEGKEHLVVDIREPHELWSGAPEGALLMPMNQVPQRLGELPRDRPIVVVCAAGMRSFGVAHYLREQGIPDSWSLAEGFGGMVSAGYAYHQPPSKGTLRLTQRVRLPPGLDLPEGSEVGTVQRLQQTEAGLRCVVQVALPGGGMRWLEDLPAEELQPA